VTEVFASLARHDIVSVVLADPSEDEGLPAWGLMELDDLEGAGRRTVFMRPALRRRWLAHEQARSDTLRRIATTYGRPPFRLVERFEAEALTRHLIGT
jgi:hypothetical protein